MPKFLITKNVTAELQVDCETESEAREWAHRIVATLEDEEWRSISLAESMQFVAYSSPSEVLVEVLS